MATYSEALVKAATGAPMSPLEYTSFVLGSSRETLLSYTPYLDNTGNVWDVAMTHGNSMAAAGDPSTNTIYFIHAAYVGPQISSTVADLGLPADALQRMAAVAGANGNAVTTDGLAQWEVVLVGVGLVATGVALAVFSAGAESPFSVPIILTGVSMLGISLALTGAAIIGATLLLGADVKSKICNPSGDSCDLYVCSTIGGCTTTTVNCTSTKAGCSATTTPAGPPGLGGDLIAIAEGIGAIALVVGGSYVGYKVLTRKKAPQPPYTYPVYRNPGAMPPPPQPNRGSTLGRLAKGAYGKVSSAARHVTTAARNAYAKL